MLILLQFLLVACGGGGGGSTGSSSGDPTADPTGTVSGSGLPDLVVTALTAPSTAIADGSYTVTGTVTNQGGSPSAGGAAVIYLSPFSDVAVDGSMVGMDVYMGVLESGQSWNFSTQVQLPTAIANGDYHIGAVAMYADEASKSNNYRSQTVTISGGATCTPDGYEADNSAAASIPLTFGVFQSHNHCEGTSDWMSFSAVAGKTYGLATKAIGDNTITALALYDRDASTLLANGSFSFPFGSVRLSWTAPTTGIYYLKVSPLHWGAATDYQAMLGDERPDLIVSSISVSDTKLVPGGVIYVHDTVYNQGFAAAGSFDIGVYLSPDPAVTSNDTLIGTRSVSSLAVDQSNYDSTNDSYTLPANLTPGTYYLAVIANPANSTSEFATTNNVSAVRTIIVEPLGSCTADAYEEDDNFPAAKFIIAGGAEQAHNHCEGDIDWLKFSAVTGNSYAIRLLRSGLSQARLELFDSDGTTHLAGDYQSTSAAIDWQTPKDGIYYLKISPYGVSGAETGYTVQVQSQLPDLAQTLTLDYGSLVIAGGFLNVTDAVSNVGYQAAGPFEIGFYRSPDATVTTADALGATRSLTELPVLSWQSTNSSWGYPVHFPKTLTPGTYYVAAIADRLNTIAELNETNNSSTPVAVTVVAPSCALDAFEDDETPATAQAIGNGESQTRNFCDDGIDWIKFTAPATGTYLAASPTSMGMLELYQADGTTRIEPHDTYFYSKLSWNATAGTDYYLKYSRSQGETTGTYQFNVSQCSPDAFDEDDTLATANSIAAGDAQLRNHCEDNEDWAKFTAVAGITYTITATNAQSVNITLYSSDSPYSLASGQATKNGSSEVITWIAPASGTYYLKADRFEFGQNTDYTLNLN